MTEFVHPHMHLVAGADEVGRDPLTGAVAIAVITLDPTRLTIGLNDSEKLSEKCRLALSDEIKEKTSSWNLDRAKSHEIDGLNALHATMLVMQRTAAGLHIAPEYVLIDGNRYPALPVPSMTVVKDDSRATEISAVPILAKATHDAKMVTLDAASPQYDFTRHKDYPTAFHLKKLALHGATEHHRRSFGPAEHTLRLSS